MNTNSHRYFNAETGRHGALTCRSIGEHFGGETLENIGCSRANQGIGISERNCERGKHDVCADIARHLTQNGDGEEAPGVLRIGQGIRQHWNCRRANVDERERGVSGGLWGGWVLHQGGQSRNGSCGVRAEDRKAAGSAPRPRMILAHDDFIPGFIVSDGVRKLVEQTPTPLGGLTLNPFQQVRQRVGADRANRILRLLELRRAFGPSVLPVKREPTGEASAVVTRFVIATDDCQTREERQDTECCNDAIAARQLHLRMMEVWRD